MNLLVRIWCDVGMYAVLSKQDWVSKGRGVNLDIAVVNYARTNGYFGFVIIFIIMSQSTPGFIINMFHDDLDKCAIVTYTLHRILQYLDRASTTPDVIFSKYQTSELQLSQRIQSRAMEFRNFVSNNKLVQYPMIND